MESAASVPFYVADGWQIVAIADTSGNSALQQFVRPAIAETENKIADTLASTAHQKSFPGFISEQHAHSGIDNDQSFPQLVLECREHSPFHRQPVQSTVNRHGTNK